MLDVISAAIANGGHTVDGKLWHFTEEFASNNIAFLIAHFPANHNLCMEFLRTLYVNLRVQLTVVQYMKDILVHVDLEGHYQSKVGFTPKSGKDVVVTDSGIN